MSYIFILHQTTTKYNYAEKTSGSQDGHDSISFYIPNDGLAVYKYLGTIDVYCTNYLYLSFYVHIDYTDTLNSVKHESRNMDDL